MYKLSPNDIVKFGRVEYTIREIKTGEIGDVETDTEFEIEDIPEEREEEPRQACRICLYDNVEYDNPLISPCYCSGTMKYIHVQCLKKWMESRVVLNETSFSKTFYWKNYDCELCKFQFPLEISYQGKTFNMVDIPKLVSPYIVLETNANNKNSTKSIHYISMESIPSVKLGRGHESEIKIPDISVSRCHALIHYKDGNFYVEDNSSKFGTLVKASDGVRIKENKQTITMQIGRTVLI